MGVCFSLDILNVDIETRLWQGTVGGKESETVQGLVIKMRMFAVSVFSFTVRSSWEPAEGWITNKITVYPPGLSPNELVS